MKEPDYEMVPYDPDRLVVGRASFQELEHRGIDDHLASAARDAFNMDAMLVQWAEEYSFYKVPGESGSEFIGRFCLYLSQMYLTMRGNPVPIPNICTCEMKTDLANELLNGDEHSWPCALSEEALKRGSARWMG